MPAAKPHRGVEETLTIAIMATIEMLYPPETAGSDSEFFAVRRR